MTRTHARTHARANPVPRDEIPLGAYCSDDWDDVRHGELRGWTAEGQAVLVREHAGGCTSEYTVPAARLVWHFYADGRWAGDRRVTCEEMLVAGEMPPLEAVGEYRACLACGGECRLDGRTWRCSRCANCLRPGTGSLAPTPEQIAAAKAIVRRRWPWEALRTEDLR